jgi:transcriptional regulator with XRE-family HTH domain
MVADDDMFLFRVGEILYNRRLLLEMSQEQVSERSGLHRTYISDIERGRRNPSLKTIVRIAAAMNMSVSDLMRLAEGETAVAPAAEKFIMPAPAGTCLS